MSIADVHTRIDLIEVSKWDAPDNTVAAIVDVLREIAKVLEELEKKVNAEGMPSVHTLSGESVRLPEHCAALIPFPRPGSHSTKPAPPR